VAARIETKTIDIGLIGAGAIARGMYVGAARGLESDGVRLVAIADAVPEKATALAADTGATAYPDHGSLLAHPGLAAVIVATTIGTHAELALAALRAGKHVLVQKPMATSLAEADQLIAEAEERDLVLQCEPPHVMHPYAEQVRQDIAAGLIGQPCLLVARAAHSGPPDRPWFYFQEHGGSVIFDMGVHALTWLLGIAGPAARVTAVYTQSVAERLINNTPLRPGIIDNALLTLQMRNGALASIITNYCTVAQLSPFVEVYGSTGTILINAPQAGYMRFSAGGVLERPGAREAGMHWEIPTHLSGHQALIASSTNGPEFRNPRLTSLGHFIDCLRTGRQPIPSGTLARHSLEIMVKAAEAAATGRTQDLQTTF
jgi:predicted dehydrogenase